MNLKDFSLMKEDEENYHVGHPSGKSMMIGKKGLSQKAHQVIMGLSKGGQVPGGNGSPWVDPKAATAVSKGATESKPENFSYMENLKKGLQGKAEGGPIDDAPQSESLQDSPESIIADAKAQAPTAAPQMTAADEQAATTGANQPASVAPDQTASQAPDEASLPGPFNTTGSLQQAQQSIQGGTQAQQKAGQQEAAAYKEAAQGIQQLETPDDKFQNYQNTDATLQKAFSDKQIDPQRYVKNLSTVSKITSALALFLGGFGQGMRGGSNPAQEYLTNAINNDIEAQKNDQTKSLNLWKMNRENLGNDQQATLATQNQLLAIAKTKAMQAQAQAQGPLAQQNASQAILGINQQIAQNNWMRSRLQGGAQGTEQAHVNDLQVMQQLRPEFYKDMQSKYVPGVGVARVPVSEGDRQALKTYDTLDKSIQDAVNFAKTKGTTLPFTQANAEADAIRQNLVTGFQTLHDLKRLSDVDLKYNLSNISSPGAFRTGAAIAQFQQLAKELNEKRQTDYNQLGIQPFQKAPQDQLAVAWAQANPQDPRAAQILASNRGRG